MSRRRTRPTPAQELQRFDVRDREALDAALALVAAKTTALTVYMCWHGGEGHRYPAEVMQAAGRLRERHPAGSGSDDTYTSLTFTPSNGDIADFAAIAAYCDLAYATDAEGAVLLEVSDEGGSLLDPHDVELDGE